MTKVGDFREMNGWFKCVECGRKISRGVDTPKTNTCWACFLSLKEGCIVEITDQKSVYFGQKGILVRRGERGGWYIKHEDDKEVYHPWGFKISWVVVKSNKDSITLITEG